MYVTDDPSVPVFHPSVTGFEAQPAGVFAGGYPVAGRGGQPVAEGDGGRGGATTVGETVQAGPFVELGDLFVGGCKQDGVAPGCDVGGPGGIGHVGGVLVGADMHTPVVDVVGDAGGVALAHRQTGRAFAGIGEPHHRREGQGFVACGDVADHPAGRDGGQLLVVADQAHAGSARQRVTDDGVKVEGGRFAGFVDDEQRVRADGLEPFAGGIVGGGRGSAAPVGGFGELNEFGHGVGGDAGVFGENFGG